MNSDHNGQARFITPLLLKTENVWQDGRRNGGERRDFRDGTVSEEQAQRVAAYDSHQVARAGAARAASRRPISNEEVNSRAAGEARSAALGTVATLAEVAMLRAALDAQAAIIEQLRLDVLASASNSFAGDGS